MKPTRMSDETWALTVLEEKGLWAYDRGGWRDVARIGAKRLLQAHERIRELEKALKEARR